MKLAKWIEKFEDARALKIIKETVGNEKKQERLMEMYEKTYKKSSKVDLEDLMVLVGLMNKDYDSWRGEEKKEREEEHEKMMGLQKEGSGIGEYNWERYLDESLDEEYSDVETECLNLKKEKWMESVLGVYSNELKLMRYRALLRQEKITHGEKIEMEKLLEAREDKKRCEGLYEEKREELKVKELEVRCARLVNEELLKKKEEIKRKEEELNVYIRKINIDNNINYNDKLNYEIESILKILDNDYNNRKSIKDILDIDVRIKEEKTESSVKFMGCCKYARKVIKINVEDNKKKYSRALTALGKNYSVNDVRLMSVLGNKYIEYYMNVGLYKRGGEYYLENEKISRLSGLRTTKLKSYLGQLKKRNEYIKALDYIKMDGPCRVTYPVLRTRLKWDLMLMKYDLIENLIVSVEPEEVDEMDELGDYSLEDDEDLIDDVDEEEQYNLHEENMYEDYVMGNYNDAFNYAYRAGEYYNNEDYKSLGRLWEEETSEERGNRKLYDGSNLVYRISSDGEVGSKKFIDIRAIFITVLKILHSFISEKLKGIKEFGSLLIRELELYLEMERRKERGFKDSYKRYIWHDLLYAEYKEMYDLRYDLALGYKREMDRDDTLEVSYDSNLRSYMLEECIEWTHYDEDLEVDMADADEENLDRGAEFIYSVSPFEDEDEELFILEYKIDTICILPGEYFEGD